MRAHWPYLQAYLTRGAMSWLATRVVVTCVLLLGGPGGMRLWAPATSEMVGVSAAAGFVDPFRRRESALMGNLEIHPIVRTGALAMPAILGEALVRVLGTVVS